jgi:23S rRNA (pseudouridine1915-N3)-methyltransferase
MFILKIFTIGKNKEAWLEAALQEYIGRLKGKVKIEWLLAKEDKGLEKLLEKEKGYVCLDSTGKLLDSNAFSKRLMQLFIAQDSRLSFVIGGAEGLSPAMKARAKEILSLSPLTFTHQLVRLILLEQIYRAFEIERGSPYHK